MENYKLKQFRKYIVLLILSLLFVSSGIFILLDKGNFFQNQRKIISKVSYKEENCIFRIINKKEDLFLNKDGKIVTVIQCKNQNLKNLPIIRSNIEIHDKDYSLNDLFDSLITLYEMNPTILNAISEVFVGPKEVYFFLNYHKIRIDVRDYQKRNWEQKLISMIIWLFHQKHRQKGILEITENEGLLIVHGEL